MSDLFEVLKITKEKNKHLVIVEHLVEAEITFVEIAEMVYRLTCPHYKEVCLFVRTGILRIVRVEGDCANIKCSWNELISIVKEGSYEF